MRAHERQDITLSENEGFKYIKESFEDIKVTMLTTSFKNFCAILRENEITELVKVIIRLK